MYLAYSGRVGTNETSIVPTGWHDSPRRFCHGPGREGILKPAVSTQRQVAGTLGLNSPQGNRI